MTVLGLVFLAAAAAGQPPTLHRVERGQPLDACPAQKGSVVRESQGAGFTVDACGRMVDKTGEVLEYQPDLPDLAAAATAPVTVDHMTTRYYGSHAAGGALTLVGSADVYSLSDDSYWPSGAGTYMVHAAQLDHVEVVGTTLRYVLTPPASGAIYEQTDYDSGNHSAQGKLGPSGALVLEAEAGSTQAVLRGNAVILSNDATYYGEPRFNYYTAVAGSVVPFEMIFTLQGGSTWTADAFSRAFDYSIAGLIDFASPVSTPPLAALSITGPSQIPDQFTTRYTAIVRYVNGIERNANADAEWTVTPAELATIADGSLTVGALSSPEAELTVRATFTGLETTVNAEKRVRVVVGLTAEKSRTWPMFQANARHTGYLAETLDPQSFSLKWQKNLGGGRALNPVTAGDGKVFASLVIYFDNIPSLFALNARTGDTLWSKNFGSVFSVNPPSYAYGNVYVQTGNHGTDTWLRAFDATTGDVLFKAPHQAQWERYFAPTINGGKTYVNGGYFGGMYSFDAFTGDQLWYASLPQYDQWTPALDADHAYAYVGEYEPGLYTQNRATGTSAYFVADPGFDWNGWSMNLAPVLGAHEDLIAIHDGRLISFDTTLHTIRWEVQSSFTGQPSVAHDRIYAIDGGRLRVLDEVTHTEIWSWQPPAGNLTGPMIVTDQYVFASSATAVYAISLDARASLWSYPVGGQLAIADKTLYVASADGKLSAFASPAIGDFYTVPPCRLVDTRRTSGVPVGAPALSAGGVRGFIAVGQCGIPTTATAVALNITVFEPGAAGALSVSPAESGVPLIYYNAGQTRANNAILRLNTQGGLFALAGQAAGTTTHLVIDVSGYFE
jgi:hypothetical protein